MLPWHWRTSKRGYPEQVAIPAEWPQTRDIGPVTESWGDSFGGHYILQLRSPVTNSSTSDGGTVRPPPRLRREPASMKQGGSMWLHDHTVRGDNTLSKQTFRRHSPDDAWHSLQCNAASITRS